MLLSENIKERRIETGMTVEELGKAINASHSTITNWEKGRKIPNGLYLVDLAKTLGTTAEKLVYGEGKEK